jgi:hypothetical protein
MSEFNNIGFGDTLIDYEGNNSEQGMIESDFVVKSAAWENITIKKKTLGKIFGNNCFEIPDYQRGFAWEEQQFEDLWREIEPLTHDSLSHRSVSDVFFGSMFFADIGDDDEVGIPTLEVIDGQQRVTTISVILRVLHKHLQIVDDQDLEKALRDHKRYIEFELLGSIFKKAKGPWDPSVVLSGHNHEFYEAMMRGEENLVEFIISRKKVHGLRRKNAIRTSDFRSRLGLPAMEEDDDDLNKEFRDTNDRLLNCFHFFNTKIEGSLPENPDSRVRALINLYEFLMNSFVVGYFEVDQGQPALLMDIFQILNDRGMDLNKVEIIRARIVACFRDGHKDESYSRYLERWEEVIDMLQVDYDTVSDLLIDYLTILEPKVSARSDVADNLLGAFVVNESLRDVPFDSRLETKSSAKEFIESLHEQAGYYVSLVYPQDHSIELDNDEIADRCNAVLLRLNSLRTKQWRPLALACYAAVRRDEVNNDEFLLGALERIENLTLRQVLLGLNPNRMERIYAAVTHEFGGDLRFDIEGALAEAFRGEYSTAHGRDFAAALIEETDFSSIHAKVLLRRVTAQRDFSDGMLAKKFRQAETHLEHVIPQSPIINGDDDKYWWMEDFFKHSGVPDLDALIQQLIQNQEDDRLTDMMERYFIEDIGNMCLLYRYDNMSISNSPLHEKLPAYLMSDGFSEVQVNGFFHDLRGTDIDVEILKDLLRLTRVRSEMNGDNWQELCEDIDISAGGLDEAKGACDDRIEELRSTRRYIESKEGVSRFWRVSNFIDRKQSMFELILDSLQFDGEEFVELDIASEIEDDMSKRLAFVKAENQIY